MTTDTRKPENEIALIKAKANVAGIFQGIYRKKGEEFLYNVEVAFEQSLASSAVEFLEPFPDGVLDPRGSNGPTQVRHAKERTDEKRPQKQEA